MKVTARARRTGGWWAVDVPEVAGAFTQVRRLDQVAEAAADAVADLTGSDPANIDVAVSPRLDADTAEVVAGTLKASEAAVEAQAVASARMRDAVRVLRQDKHLSTRDVAELLEVSPQRVSQLG